MNLSSEHITALRSPLLCDVLTPWVTPEERRSSISTLHREGRKLTDIAVEIGCSYKTVLRDLGIIGVTPFTQASDDELKHIIEDIIHLGHASMGAYHKIKGALREKGYRVPLHRIERILVWMCLILEDLFVPRK